ncbi:NUDIX domain-containing protein [Okibacterium endophyticum]
MTTPPFVLALRAKIGHDELWLSGVTAVVERDGEVLLVKRTDDGTWTSVTGIIDPGEEPAVAAEREVLEEAGIVAVAERLAWVHSLSPHRWQNGDLARFLDLTFRCRYVSGMPHPADGENSEVGWFAVDALPPMSEDQVKRIDAALSDDVAARFER